MPNQELVFNEEAWPVLEVLWPPGDPDEQIIIFMERLKGYFARGERFALVIDGSEANPLSATGRQYVTQQMRALEDDMRAYFGCVSLVISSAAVRGVLTAITWVWRPRYELMVFAEMDEARQWAVKQLASTSGG